MANEQWKKGVVIGIIFVLFISTAVPPIQADGIVWDVTIFCSNPATQNDYVVFGEATDANDGAPSDAYDVLKPPAPMTPYIRVWFNDNLPSPYDLLTKDYRSYPDVVKIWNLTVHWMPSGGASPTTITMSWDISEFTNCEYDTVTLCNEGGAPLQDMLVNNFYFFDCPAYVPQNFKIICSKIINQPPNVPTDPNPSDGSTNVPLTTSLSWTGGDPDSGDAVFYDVYFDTTNPPATKVSANQTTTTYDPGSLAYNSLYYWKIISWDTPGASTSGPVWSFATQEEPMYTLTTHTIGSGSVVKSPDQLTYSYGAVVELTAIADPGWSFDSWSGDLTGDDNPVNIVINGNTDVTATFVQNEYTLGVTTVGSGSVTKDPDQVTYHYGDTVLLTAIAAPYWVFSHWTGDLTGSANPDSLVITGDSLVTAVFTQNQYILTLGTIGQGSIGKDPDQMTYPAGTVVQLTATADPGWSFSQWSGDLTGSMNPAFITMDGNKTVTATFTQDEYTLGVSVVGSGSVMKDPDQVTYHYGDVVQLTAVAAPGWSFSYWSGDLTGSVNPESLMITGNMVVTATFTQNEYSLSVSIVGQGSVSRDPDQLTYVYGTIVELTAIADAGWSFDSWSGDLTGDDNPVDIVINGNKEVFATFIQNDYTLGVTTMGSGSVMKDPDQVVYHYGDLVGLTAIAAPGWSFDSWSGDLTGSMNPAFITMDGNKTVTATFTQDEYTLSVSVVGSGSVMKNPDQVVYHYGDVVELTAVAAPGWSFSYWSGDLTGSTNPESLMITGDMVVTATFTQNEYTLSVSIVGQGSVSRDPDQLTYVYGTVVELSAVADPGWSFDSWGGDLSGSMNPINITMNGNKTVTAIFVQDEYILTVTIVGLGTVDIQPEQVTYQYGDLVQLTASAAVGWSFGEWSGGLSGDINPISLTIYGDTTVFAVFTQDEYTLSLLIVGSGSVEKLPDQDTYHYGDLVQLTASAAVGWSFVEWSGDLTGTINPSTILIEGDTTITASFIQNEYLITITVIGSGSVEKSPDQATYHHGDLVALTAVAAPGWSFDSWGDDLSSSENPASLLITGDMTVTATFTQDEYTLNLMVVGDGSVQKSPDQLTYQYGDVVELTAVPDIGWSFSIWGGDLSGSTNPTTITIMSDALVSATFTQNEYTLSVSLIGSGSVHRQPDQPTYHYGDSVELTATADPGWSFVSWSGDLGGSDNPAVLTIDGDKLVTATFIQNEYTLGVSSIGFGSVTKDPDQVTYHYGDVVLLTAVADPFWVFSYWTGDLTGSVNPESLVINGDSTVTAVFTQNEYTLTVSTVGQGFISKDPDQMTYPAGTVVQLTATADPGWSFSQWSGDLTGSMNPAFITMDGNKTVTATFTQDEYTLGVSVVGSGSVMKDPDQVVYHYGDVVELTAVADPGWSFDSWSGDLTGSMNPVFITMDGNKTVTATFTQDEYTLNLMMVGDGSVQKSPDQLTYQYGDVVELTAIPNTGWSFSEWSGGLSGDVTPASVTIYGDTLVTATFTQDEYTIDVSVVGAGSVLKMPDLPTYHYGDVVQVTAVADLGWSFSHWGGDLSGSMNPNSITIDGNKTVTATFVQDEYILSVTIVGSGAVDIQPEQVTYRYGDLVQLTASAAVGWSFVEWSGDLTGTINPSTILVEGDTTITASFIQNEYIITITVVGSGSVEKSPDQATYHYGDLVVLTAVAAPGWSFDSWGGDLSGSLNPETVMIQGDMTVIATFTVNQYTLTVQVVGSGSVDVDPIGGVYDYGTLVSLTALPSVGWSFSYWSGALSGSVNPEFVVITGDMVVTATFTQDEYTLTISTVGQGFVSKNPDQLTYAFGTVVELSAVADPGWSFNEWSGDVTGSMNPAFITMDGNKTVTATFTEDEYTLSVSVVGSGLVMKNPDQVVYHYGDVVELTAVANPGWVFSEWFGDLSGSVNPSSLTISGDAAVTALFTQIEYTVDASVVGAGSVVKLPDLPTYHYGNVVQVTAVADLGWSFSQWGGDLSGSMNPEFLVVSGDMMVTATFIQDEYTLDISVVGSGDVMKDPDQITYHYGAVVQVTAVADLGWSFAGWSGDLSGMMNPESVVMDTDKVVTATFLESIVNTPPYTPNTPVPPDGADEISTTLQLSWSGGDPDIGDIVTYDVYFGTTNPPGKVSSNQSLTVFDPGVLLLDTPYFWKIIAWDNQGASAEGVVWSFSTGSCPSVWLYRKMITIDHTLVVEPQTDFPVLIKSESDSDLRDHAQEDADDLYFTDSSGLRLAHEIESYDAGTGGLVAWVKVPSLSSTIDTILYLYYGNPCVGSQQDAKNTWDVSFRAVHHLEESSGVVSDSTAYGNDGVVSGGLDMDVSGWIDGADRFDGIDDRIVLPQVFTSEVEFTVEFWMYAQPGARYIVSQRLPFVQGLIVQLAADGYLQWIMNGTRDGVSVSMNQWHYVALRFDGVTVRFSVDGGAARVKLCSVPVWPADGMYLGDGAIGNRQFHGMLDEIRFSSVSRSYGWIRTSYQNQHNPFLFAHIGSELILQQSPVITGEAPVHHALNVPVMLSELRVTLVDYQDDLLSYTVTTSPDIIGGIQSGMNIPSGTTIALPIVIHPLDYHTLYTWTVQVTDGVHSTTETFSFTTQDTSPAWLYRKMITIDHTQVSGTLTEFPVLIKLPGDADLSSHAQEDGDDIYFTDSSGLRLAHEIESYDAGTGGLVAWIRVPSLSGAVNTVLYLYYGNPAAENQQDAEGTWDVSFRAVHHLEESSGVVSDSTVYGNDGVVSGGLDMDVSGWIDGADRFDGIDDHVLLPQVFTSEVEFTVEFWMYAQPGARYIVSQRLPFVQGLIVQLAADGYLQWIMNGTRDGLSVSMNQWHYVALRFDGMTVRFSVDGGAARVKLCSVPVWPADGMYLGDGAIGNRQFHGMLDEIRFSSVARSSGWIATSYRNQATPLSFFILGAEETL